MQRLSRTIPLKKAMGMMLTGRHVSAKEGYELGFVTEVVPGLQPVQVAALREMLIGGSLILILRLRPTGLLPERLPQIPLSEEKKPT